MARQLLNSIDLFPARVRTPRAEYERSRLVVHEQRAYVWIEQEKQVVLIEEAEVVSFGRERQSKAPYVIDTAEGEAWECGRSSGCGCGASLLRDYNWRVNLEQVNA